MKTYFGDLPDEGKELLIQHLRIDYSHCTFKSPKWFSAYARNPRGRIVGIFATEFMFWFEGRINILVLDPRCVTRRALKATFTALFSQATRLTAEIEPHNRRALRLVQEMDFTYEGYRRLGLEGTRDVMMFSQLRHECPYLRGYVRPTAAALDVPNRVIGDAKTPGEVGDKLFGTADSPNLRERELGVGRHSSRSVH